MKVFHGLVNYGTQAGFLAKGLKDNGIEAISVVHYDKSKRIVDIELNYSSSKLIRYYQEVFNFIRFFRKYNIFHFYYGKSILPFNLDLPFYRLFKKKVIMEYLGHDIDFCLGLNGYNHRGEKFSRLKKIKQIYSQSKMVDKQIVCAPYYYQFVDNSVVLPLAIDINHYKFSPLNLNQDYLKIMHCPTHRIYKKSDIIEDAIYKLIDEGYKIKYKCITNVTHDKLIEEYLSSDIIIDQLNSWYGTVSIEAMALGRPVVCGYHKHLTFYEYEKFGNLPIINADIYNVYNVLKDILEGKYNLEEISIKSRKFVENVHSLNVVTNQLIDIYKNL